MRKRLLSSAAWLSVLIALYGLYHLASHNGWIIVTHGARRIDAGRPPLATGHDQELSLFVVGDTGQDSQQRRRVVSMMGQQAGPAEINAVLMLGDNFYEYGVKSASDPRFETDFENLFDRDLFDCPFYVCLGNHDYNGDTLAQVEYQCRSSRWKMPAKYYRFGYDIGTESVDVFVLDTIPIDQGGPAASEQLAWLESELRGSEATWKVAMGHHPILSGGRHGGSQEVAASIAPLLRKYAVDFYLSGHDHDLQLLDSQSGWRQIVSGAGSKLRSTSWIKGTEFAAAKPGFCWLLFRPHKVFVTFFGTDRRLMTKSLVKTARRSPAELSSGQLLSL